MKKIFAIISTLITLYVLKETINIFISTDAGIIKERPILIVIALSFLIPLIILSLWLWSPGRKQDQEQIRYEQPNDKK
ncbi:hypothetical protein [Pedobacter sp. BMA]|uniref:hypothetical protein n=1 Tax=Pedobacter sp. BMA TaxID=1663685 RepID=UPI00064AB78E|nr:hypothetical protein [Pedobacter sp. BMA]